MARKKREVVTIAKWRGDDRHSWAVFRNGVPVIGGLTRAEARYHRDRIKEMINRT